MIEKNINSEIEIQNNELNLPEAAEVINELPNMNYMELMKLRRDMNRQLEELISAMNIVKSFESVETPDELGRKIALNNILQDGEYQKDIEYFKNGFDKDQIKIKTVIEAIDTELIKFGGPKGTKFYNDQMIDTLKKSIARFEGKEDEYSKELNVLNNTLNAFKNRSEIDYILSKAKGPDICRIKANLIQKSGKCASKTISAFTQEFSEKQLSEFYKYISCIFENDDKAASVFLTHMAKILKSGLNTGEFNYIKVLVMNVLDIIAGVYDMEGGKEDFDKKLLQLYNYYK